MAAINGMTALIGRILLGWFFVSQAVQRINEWGAMVILVEMKHVPLGQVSLAMSLIAMFFGSVGLVTGFQTRFSAFALAICTGAWVAVAHDFWTIQNPIVRQADFLIFSLGVAIIGGLLSFIAFGAGRFSLDGIETQSSVN